jgi:hypothetical protein
MHYKGYEIVESSGHGKNVKGYKKTTTNQVRKPCPTGYYLKAQIRFIVGEDKERIRAIQKAKSKVDALLIMEDK